MARTASDGDECDPNTFYSIESEALDKAAHVGAVVDYATTAFIFCFAPFLILAPFFVNKLNLLTRKIIAMIVLSDTLKFIGDMTLALRSKKYRQNLGGYIVQCSIVSVIQTAAPLWSMTWAFLLILGIWLSLQDRFKLFWGRDGMFFFFNCIAWPLGFLETVIQYIHMDKYKIAFFENYVTSESCQSNFTFVLRENGTKCLLGEYGAPFLASYYIFAFVVIVATNVVFVGVFIRAYINWRKTERQVEARAEQLSRAVGFIVAASSHRNLLISSIQYSVIGFIYAVTYFPVTVYKIYVVYYGPVEKYPNFLVTIVAYNFITNNFTSVMNILFYGFFSKVFRGEMIRIFWQFCRKLRNFHQDVQQRIPDVSSRFRGSSRLPYSSACTNYDTDTD